MDLAVLQCRSHAQTDIATTYDEHALTAKARRQRAQWVLI